MIAIYLFNLALAVLLLLWPLWFSRYVLHFRRLNPLTIPMLISMPVEVMRLLAGPIALIDGGLWNPGFQYAVLMANLFTLSQVAGTLTFFRLAGTVRLENHLPFRTVVLTPRYLTCASLVFLAIFAIAFCLLAGAQFGIMEWIKNPRVGYQQYRAGQGHWYALALNALSVAAMCAFLARPLPRAVLVKVVFFVALAYLLGSKGIMLAMFTAGFVVLCFIGWPYITRLFLLGVPVIFILLLWNLYLSISDNFEVQAILEYFDYYKNAADYYSGVLKGDIQLFHGEVLATSFWAYVPRVLVPDKPFVYGILHVNEIFFPGQAELTNTPDFGGAVFQYADFGVSGVLLFGFISPMAFLNAALLYLLFRSPGVTVTRLTLGQFLVVLAQFGPLFGLYFPGLLYVLLLVTVAVVLRLVRPPRRQGTPVPPNGLPGPPAGGEPVAMAP